MLFPDPVKISGPTGFGSELDPDQLRIRHNAHKSEVRSQSSVVSGRLMLSDLLSSGQWSVVVSGPVILTVHKLDARGPVLEDRVSCRWLMANKVRCRWSMAAGSVQL